jgi:hypothetical protein
MYYLNNMRVLWQARALFVPLACQGSTLSSKDAARAKPHQSGIHPDQQQPSGKTVSDLFEPLETWDNTATKRVGRSLRRHIAKVIRCAQDPPFEQELTKRVGKLLASERAFKVAEHLPLWRTHHIAVTMGFELVSDTFGMLMQHDPYYQISTVLKESVFIPLFASERNQSDKQDIIFWMKQGGTIVYRKLSKPIHTRQSCRTGV